MSPENVITQEFDVFVSNSSKEKAIADAVVATMNRPGSAVGMPRSIRPSDI